MEERFLQESEGLFENKGLATKDAPFYFAADSVEVDKKNDEQSKGYFFSRQGASCCRKVCGLD